MSQEALVGGLVIGSAALVVGNPIMRFTSPFVGIAFPTYQTWLALEQNDNSAQREWLTYWAVYGCFTGIEAFADKILSWFPHYYTLKTMALLWLQHPRTRGARVMYQRFVSPLLARHRNTIEGTVNEAHRMALQQAVSIGRTTQSAVSAVFAELRAQGRLQLQAADEQALLQAVVRANEAALQPRPPPA